MKLHLARVSDVHQITHFGGDHIAIDGTRHAGSLILLPDEIVIGWAASFEAIALSDFETIVLRAPEIVLLGTGPRQRFPAPALYSGLIKAGIGVEVMSTAAACRTYNILAAEGRRVAAALILPA